MGKVLKLRAVRAIVRPDRRDEYLARWREYASASATAGATVRLYEDQALPGRFLEFTEHAAAAGAEAELERALRSAEISRAAVRREGDDILYRPVAFDE
jgi:hypothetical protein